MECVSSAKGNEWLYIVIFEVRIFNRAVMKIGDDDVDFKK